MSNSIDATLTFQVGSGGDYTTINSAIEEITKKYYPAYKKVGVEIVLNLVSGFVMSEQILVTGLDLSWIKITGADASTTIDRSALTTQFHDGYPAFGGYRSFLPAIGQLFDMNTSGTATERHGILCFDCSRGVVLSDCGFTNVGGRGCFAVGSSSINANGGNFNRAGDRCIHAERASSIDANNASADNAGMFGIQATRAATINARFATAVDSSNYGIVANNGSNICAREADASGAFSSGFWVQTGGIITANDATGTLAQRANKLTENGIIFQ